MNEEEKIENQKPIISKKEKKEMKINTKKIVIIALTYLITMIIFPIIVYMIFYENIYEVAIYKPGMLWNPEVHTEYMYKYETIIHIIFLIFDIIFTFTITKKLLRDSYSKKILTVVTLISPIIKILLLAVITTTIYNWQGIFYSLHLTSYENFDSEKIEVDESLLERYKRDYYGNNAEDKNIRIFQPSKNNIIFESALNGKTGVGYYSYGVYIVIIGESIYGFMKKKLG